MEAHELDFPSEQMLSCLDMTDTQCTSSFDIDEFLDRTQACTHAHACNPPGPDNSHTHTCIHVHTQIVPDPSDDTAESDEKKDKKRRPSGNREAVRKYREKKKARTASLEDEVVRLRSLNQQLMKRVQGQALLEAEIARLKCLLVDVRGRIDGEIGSFPYQKPATKNEDFNRGIGNGDVSGTYAMNSCNVRCDDQISCLGSEIAALNGRDCGFDDLRCLGDRNYGPEELPEGGDGVGGVNGVSIGNSSRIRKRKGSLAAKAS